MMVIIATPAITVLKTVTTGISYSYRCTTVAILFYSKSHTSI